MTTELSVAAPPAPAVRHTQPRLPVPYRVVARRRETPDTVTLRLEPVFEALADFVPGQFAMVHCFGRGLGAVSGTDPRRAQAHQHRRLRDGERHPRHCATSPASRSSAAPSTPGRSILVRAVEIVYTVDEALRVIAMYEPPSRPSVEVPPVAGTGHGATEAPRGLLYHRYALAADGTVTDALLVPPTAQNQGAIEDDLRRTASQAITRDDLNVVRTPGGTDA
ncbi:hypothetical protein GCM10010252_76600 [Streptomyces aureoverticillatus]|nr:hypothetical protein GCM10010252_76600 [Streptomyces aureoverticillatus]